MVFLFNYFNSSNQGLRVLMYHKLSENSNDKLTLSVNNFENQIIYLLKHNYNPINLEQLTQYQFNKIQLPKKPILICFDDAYENNFLYLYPLLIKYGIKATIFLPVGLLGKLNTWDEGSEPIMSMERLKEMDSAFVEFGLHSFSHINYSKISGRELNQDIIDSKTTLTENSIPYIPAIAYPFGSFPREKNEYIKFIEILKKNGILFGFRIGNKINKLPLLDRFCIKRIDVKGTDSFLEFRIKIWKGRIKPF